jgi:hypothetical protein
MRHIPLKKGENQNQSSGELAVVITGNQPVAESPHFAASCAKS